MSDVEGRKILLPLFGERGLFWVWLTVKVNMHKKEVNMHSTLPCTALPFQFFSIGNISVFFTEFLSNFYINWKERWAKSRLFVGNKLVCVSRRQRKLYDKVLSKHSSVQECIFVAFKRT